MSRKVTKSKVGRAVRNSMTFRLSDLGLLDGLILPLGFDVGVDADDDGQAVDRGFGGFISVAAGDRERLAGERGRSLKCGVDVW